MNQFEQEICGLKKISQHDNIVRQHPLTLSHNIYRKSLRKLEFFSKNRE